MVSKLIDVLGGLEFKSANLMIQFRLLGEATVLVELAVIVRLLVGLAIEVMDNMGESSTILLGESTS